MERHLTRRRFLQAGTVAAGMMLAPSFVPCLTIDSVSADDVPLRQPADAAGIQIGCELTGVQIDNPTWQMVVGREFNLAVIAWGIGDKYDYLVAQKNLVNAAPTMFDDDLNPKPAFYAFRNAFQSLS